MILPVAFPVTLFMSVSVGIFVSLSRCLSLSLSLCLGCGFSCLFTWVPPLLSSAHGVSTPVYPSAYVLTQGVPQGVGCVYLALPTGFFSNVSRRERNNVMHTHQCQQHTSYGNNLMVASISCSRTTFEVGLPFYFCGRTTDFCM